MKLVIVTGISGCNRKEYLNKWENYCKERGKKVKIFHVGELMFKHAYEIGLELNSENILNADPDLLHALRSAVFKGILAEISGSLKDYDAVVICIHGFFVWKKRFQRAYDRFLNQFSPDMFITFVDDAPKMLKRLNERPQWQNEGLTHAEILSWQNVEVEVTSGWAEFAEKTFFAIAVEQPISTFYKLLFHPEIEPVYIAMPISHFREPADRARIDEFIRKLDGYFTVFNPLSVEAVGAVSVRGDRTNWAIYHHTVHRDLYWFVRKSKKIIVLWPKTVASPGVNHETHESFAKTKDVWVVYLGEEASPFIAYFNTRLFTSEEEFFSFIDEKYPERKDLNWD